MANLDLEVGGRRFAVSCQPGEEDHITNLARMIDTRVRDAGAIGQSEPRMLLFAALLLADEVLSLREGEKVPDVEARAAREKELKAIAEQTARREQERDKQVAERVDAVTARIENIVRHLEGSDHHA